MASSSNERCKSGQNHQCHRHPPIFDTPSVLPTFLPSSSPLLLLMLSPLPKKKTSRCNQLSVFRVKALCSTPCGNLKLCLLLVWFCCECEGVRLRVDIILYASRYALPTAMHNILHNIVLCFTCE